MIVASELGFHWIGNFAHAVFVAPAQGLRAAWNGWRERRANPTAALARAPRVVREKSESTVTTESGVRPAARSAVPVRAGTRSPNGTRASAQEADASPQIRLPLPGLQKVEARPRESRPRLRP